jgi:hypothetical protein
MAKKTPQKAWLKQQEPQTRKVHEGPFVCLLCEKVKSLALTPALFGHWHEDPDDETQMIVVCHPCQEADEAVA